MAAEEKVPHHWLSALKRVWIWGKARETFHRCGMNKTRFYGGKGHLELHGLDGLIGGATRLQDPPAYLPSHKCRAERSILPGLFGLGLSVFSAPSEGEVLCRYL